MKLIEYESRGVPLEEYTLTRRDHHDQRRLEQIIALAREQVDRDVARIDADPVMAERRRRSVANALQLLASFQKPDHEIMRWRVRLYCGHITETRRHREGKSPTLHGPSWEKCPVCGQDPSAIVAFQPIAPAAEPPTVTSPVPPPPPRRPTRAALEHRLAELEAENERLRSLTDEPATSQPNKAVPPRIENAAATDRPVRRHRRCSTISHPPQTPTQL
ncbi:hypothetical protein [Embleya sp. NBC_00896]|uniref:hypothetical protein n=1 Tax=Embleya sp. NBC_00896 TaxID=2975961 RepID=UPI002F90DF68|nr:hypothetical protein OG928_46760 [Embleya sp. NBC_00896]